MLESWIAPILFNVALSQIGLAQSLFVIENAKLAKLLKQFVQCIFQFKRFEVQAKHLFSSLQPAALIIPSDRYVGAQLAFIKIARKNRCPVVFVPFAYSGSGSGNEDCVITRRKSVWHYIDAPPLKIVKRWIARKYPFQISRFVNFY